MSLNFDMSSWQKVKFGDVVRNLNENVKSPSALGIERVIGLEHLDPRELRIQRWAELTSDTNFSRRVRPGQTLFGKRRAYQRKTAYSEFDAVCSGDILVFESADVQVLLPELLPFIATTDSFYEKAIKTSAGSLSPRTRWSNLATYEFDLPPLDQQKRIAELLWAIEETVSTGQKTLDAGVATRDAYTVGTIWGEASNFVELRSLAQDGRLLDGDWIESKDMEEGGSVRLLQLADVGVGSFLDRSDRWISSGKAQELGVTHLSQGDLLISRMADPIGRTCEVPDLGYPSITAVDVAILRPQVDIPRDWLLAVLNSPQWVGLVVRQSRGTTRTRISRSNLESLFIPDPYSPETGIQNAKIRQLDGMRLAVLMQLSKAKSLRNALLNELWGHRELQ